MSPKLRTARPALPVLALLAASLAPAQAQDSAGPCPTIADDARRLACYDAQFGRTAPAPAAGSPPAAPAAPAALASDEARVPMGATAGSEPPGSWLGRLWDLDPGNQRGTFELRPHQASYLLPLRYSSHPNKLPASPAPGHALTEPLSLDRTEAKFQLSVKLKLAESLVGDNGDLWFGYTQQSSWQLYNRAQSSPVRESNYEPEVMFSWRTGHELLGWRWRLLNLGLVHQSNGRGGALSRSWNRVYAQFGIERGDLALLVRPWKRIGEGRNDDNPDIGRYLGSGDLRLVYTRGAHVYSGLARLGAGGRGLLQLDWSFPLVPRLNGYLQLTHGSGESLIDYNHRQTTLGVGLLLLPWR